MHYVGLMKQASISSFVKKLNHFVVQILILTPLSFTIDLSNICGSNSWFNFFKSDEI